MGNLSTKTGYSTVQTRVTLANNGATNVQDFAAYDGQELTGFVYVDATSDYRSFVKVSVLKNGAGTYTVAVSAVNGDLFSGSPIVSFAMSGSVLQATLPNITGYVSAYIQYNLNAPALGGNLPLTVDSSTIASNVFNASTGSGYTFKDNTGATIATFTGSTASITGILTLNSSADSLNDNLIKGNIVLGDGVAAGIASLTSRYYIGGKTSSVYFDFRSTNAIGPRFNVNTYNGTTSTNNCYIANQTAARFRLATNTAASSLAFMFEADNSIVRASGDAQTLTVIGSANSNGAWTFTSSLGAHSFICPDSTYSTFAAPTGTTASAGIAITPRNAGTARTCLIVADSNGLLQYYSYGGQQWRVGYGVAELLVGSVDTTGSFTFGPSSGSAMTHTFQSGDTNTLIVKSSASNKRAALYLRRGSLDSVIGSVGANDEFITGTIAEDLAIQSTGNILIATGGASTKCVNISTAGVMTVGPNASSATNLVINGALSSTVGILGRTSGTAYAAGYVGEKITWSTPPTGSTNVTSTTDVDWANATFTLTAGIWLMIAHISVGTQTSAASGDSVSTVVRITDSANTLIQNAERQLYTKTTAAVTGIATSLVSFSVVVAISGSTTYKIRTRVSLVGSGSGYLYNAAGAYSEFYAIRIG